MTTTIIYTIISLCAIGIASAVILYFVAQKFKVEEDPELIPWKAYYRELIAEDVANPGVGDLQKPR